ncbi:acetyltransferase [Herbaspirillum lusitanum]|uniref:acetyltransferase n=1 Tax=Herbaspirillum lusitanum TaxID=213312 RepID=UPI0022370375|nr:acetyltransferase [Herbaspirillum lusitanum]MCW5299433.1 acetyltransferase [Herbaspirillum lusitanum]
MRRIVLAGNAVTADILNAYLAHDKRYHVVGSTVDDDFLQAGRVNDMESVPLSRLKEVFKPEDCTILMAMGYNDLNRVRESMFHRLKEMGYAIETYVHPDAKVYTEHALGEGAVVMPSAVVEAHVRVGANSMVWANVTLAHHCSVAENCWIASGAVISGNANVSRNCFVGVNATIVNEVTVGEYGFVGAGALITRDTKASSVQLARSAEEHRFASQDYVKFYGL